MNAQHKPGDIERENLEAHVEICAIRYDNLDARLGRIEKVLFWGGSTAMAALIGIALKLWLG